MHKRRRKRKEIRFAVRFHGERPKDNRDNSYNSSQFACKEKGFRSAGIPFTVCVRTGGGGDEHRRARREETERRERETRGRRGNGRRHRERGEGERDLFTDRVLQVFFSFTIRRSIVLEIYPVQLNNPRFVHITFTTSDIKQLYDVYIKAITLLVRWVRNSFDKNK